MAEPLTREQFRVALAQSVDGVLNVYQEVDAMLRELAMALAAEEPRFKTLIKRIVPGAGKNPDTRFLRNYHASIFALADADVEDEDEEDEDADTDAEDEEESGSRKSKKPLTVAVGSGIVLARAAIYDRSTTAFEPNLIVASLKNWRVAGDVPPGTPIRVARRQFKVLLRLVENHRGAAGKAVTTLKTAIPVQPVGFPKGKHTLLCELPSVAVRRPLYEVTPTIIQEVARGVRSEWSPSSTAG